MSKEPREILAVIDRMILSRDKESLRLLVQALRAKKQPQTDALAGSIEMRCLGACIHLATP